MSKAAAKLRDKGAYVMPTIRVPLSIHQKTKRAAAREGRSFSNYVVAQLAKAVAKQQRRRQAAAG